VSVGTAVELCNFICRALPCLPAEIMKIDRSIWCNVRSERWASLLRRRVSLISLTSVTLSPSYTRHDDTDNRHLHVKAVHQSHWTQGLVLRRIIHQWCISCSVLYEHVMRQVEINLEGWKGYGILTLLQMTPSYLPIRNLVHPLVSPRAVERTKSSHAAFVLWRNV
jgi:hypothetical protein